MAYQLTNLPGVNSPCIVTPSRGESYWQCRGHRSQFLSFSSKTTIDSKVHSCCHREGAAFVNCISAPHSTTLRLPFWRVFSCQVLVTWPSCLFAKLSSLVRAVQDRYHILDWARPAWPLWASQVMVMGLVAAESYLNSGLQLGLLWSHGHQDTDTSKNKMSDRTSHKLWFSSVRLNESQLSINLTSQNPLGWERHLNHWVQSLTHHHLVIKWLNRGVSDHTGRSR